MIWSIVSKAEMDGAVTTPVFSTYQEALGRNNIKLGVVDTSVESEDYLDFVSPNDTVLLRTADEKIIKSIIAKGCLTTAERYSVYKLIDDKEESSKFLRKNFISVPKQYKIDEITDHHTYFVKPRVGSDSMNISEKSICHFKREVRKMYRHLCTLGISPVIEDFIGGNEYTVACLRFGDEIMTAPIRVECDTAGGIQTFEGKLHIKEFCSAVNDIAGYSLQMVAREVLKLLGIKHHARIDFRSDKNGDLYVIDVNAMPGLGMKAHFSKCFLLSRNYSYIDTMRLILRTATKL